MNSKKILMWSNAFFVVLLIYAACKYMMAKQELEREKAGVKRMSGLLALANRIIRANSQGKTMSGEIEKLGIRTVAVYGMGEIGERLMEDILLNSSVELLYGIDVKAAELLNMAVPVYTLQQAAGMEKPDLVILTVLGSSDSLREEIQEKMSCEVMMIGELLCE